MFQFDSKISSAAENSTTSGKAKCIVITSFTHGYDLAGGCVNRSQSPLSRVRCIVSLVTTLLDVIEL